ncbi:MAG: YukJ family protein [Nitrospira sp.]
MPLKRYGVLKGKAVGATREEDQSSPHYQVHIQAGTIHYRIAVNVKSQLSPSELLFFVDDDFRHPITATLSGLSDDFTLLSSKPGGSAVDFIRGNLFNRSDMRLLPPNLPGPDNDLSDQIEHYVKRAMQEPTARVYAFGSAGDRRAGRRTRFLGFVRGTAFTTFI